MAIFTSAEQLIGNTPLLELTNIEREEGLCAKLYAKLECFNPTGSAKDRAAKGMLDDAEKRGLIKPGATIVEPTSGNTGIGLASLGSVRGYKVIIVMPDSMSKERIITMQAYGAEVVLTDGKLGMLGAIEKAKELAETIPGSFIPGQFDNPANSKAHFESTGPEIYNDLDGKLDYFIAGIGTGGTFTGTGSYLKSKKNDIKLIAFEPAASPLLSEGRTGAHDLQGIGGNTIPAILDRELYDEIMTVKDEDAYEYGRKMGEKEGILVGITSGAALWAAVQVAKRPEAKGKNIVFIMPDTGSRYLSSKMFQK